MLGRAAMTIISDSCRPSRHPIELGEAGGNAGDSAAALVEFLDRLDRLHHLVFHRQHLTFEAVFAHRENLLLHFVEEIVHFVLFSNARRTLSVQAAMIWRRMYFSRTISR